MASNGSPLPADWWRGTQFDQGGKFYVPTFANNSPAQQAQTASQLTGTPWTLSGGNYSDPAHSASVNPANYGSQSYVTAPGPISAANPLPGTVTADPYAGKFMDAYGTGGRAADIFQPVSGQPGVYSRAFELTPEQRAASGLNNGRVFLNYSLDPKTGLWTADPNSMSVGEATQNQSNRVTAGRAAIIMAAMAAGSAAVGGAFGGAGAGAGAGAEGGVAASGAGMGEAGGAGLGGVGWGAGTGGATAAGTGSGILGAAGGGGAAGGAADVGYMGPGSAGAGATGEVGAAAPEASGSLLSQLTPQQIASAVQQYGPTAIKALGMIAASTAAQHAANSQNSSGSSSNAAGVAPWNYQQQPIAPGSAFGGGMFGQQQGNPMMRGYQFGNMGGPGKMPQMPPPQQGQSPQNPYMPQGFGGMMGGPSQQAMQQYQQQLFQQHSGPGGFYGFQAPVAQQQMPQQALSQQMPSSPLYNNNGPQMPQVPQYMPRANIQPGMVSQPVSGGSTPQQWWGNLPSGLFGRVT